MIVGLACRERSARVCLFAPFGVWFGLSGGAPIQGLLKSAPPVRFFRGVEPTNG